MKSSHILVLAPLGLLAGCRLTPWRGVPYPTPPGWRSLVSNLLVEDTAFPEGWARERDLPVDSLTDPTINHVYRRWWDKEQGTGMAEQAIWRALTIRDAEEEYVKLRQSPLFSTQFTPNPDDEPYVQFWPPTEIGFQSRVADEFFLACGWTGTAYCEAIGRYRNYVAYMRLGLEAEYGGHTSKGLTYAEVGSAVEAMDAKFADFLAAFPLPTPSP